MQPTTAIIFSSGVTGKTKKTGKYIAKALDADLFDLKKQTTIDLTAYNKLIFGTGIHAGKPYKALVSFLENNKDEIAKKKTSLFICCLFDEEKGQKQCDGVSETLGISDAVFFSGKTEKNEEGFETIVDDFISKQRV